MNNLTEYDRQVLENQISIMKALALIGGAVCGKVGRSELTEVAVDCVRRTEKMLDDDLIEKAQKEANKTYTIAEATERALIAEITEREQKAAESRKSAESALDG